MNKAKDIKIDEFYTMMSDIGEELIHYVPQFYDKVIYCCCDNPSTSNFYKYLCDNYYEFHIKEVIATSIENHSTPAMVGEYSSNKNHIGILNGDGKFNSKECIPYWEKADIIITNPPFSQAVDFLLYINEMQKKFLIVSNRNTVVTKKVFPLLQNKQIVYGYGFKNNTANFIIPSALVGKYTKDVTRKQDDIVRFRNIVWLTNLNVVKQTVPREYTCTYNPEKYPKYDQYDAINIDRISEIPIDYENEMGVPITFLENFDNYNFELLGMDRFMPNNQTGKRFTINGKEKYARIIIRKKQRQ